MVTEITNSIDSNIPATSQRLKFDGLMAKFLGSLDIKLSSKRTYKEGFKRFINYITKHAIITPELEHLIAYKVFLESQKLSSLTISGYLVVVRQFFTWLEANKRYPNISKGIRSPKRSKGFRKDPLTIDQIQELLASIDTFSLQGKRDLAIINLLVRTGLRTIEIVHADVEDIRQLKNQYRRCPYPISSKTHSSLYSRSWKIDQTII